MYSTKSIYSWYQTGKICQIAVFSDLLEKEANLECHFSATVNLAHGRRLLDHDQRQMSDFHIFTQHPLWVVTHTAAISYPGSSGFLVSGWAPVETLGFCYRKISNSAVKQWKSLQGSQSKNLHFFEFPRVSTGAHPLTKKPEDSGFEIDGLVDGDGRH